MFCFAICIISENIIGSDEKFHFDAPIGALVLCIFMHIYNIHKCFYCLNEHIQTEYIISPFYLRNVPIIHHIKSYIILLKMHKLIIGAIEKHEMEQK